MFIHGNTNYETPDLDEVDRSPLVYPGKDGVPRVARFRTSHGERIRPFQRLYPLEVSAKTEISVLKASGKASLPVEKTPESSTDLFRIHQLIMFPILQMKVLIILRRNPLPKPDWEGP
ncbi:hypothetical protein TNIN_8941 [Trichonephila inaurata madagascariensis]|uniref:Uncharacterized protein n=1 Tax=Trichonephila inaurata madagascariensis TaxID=2747483 RepID=A0A8X6IGL3_9ARAC|nr:hypothetical protein TNIN_8941 [Trichonephila inaurata madagascariensis]